MNDDVQAAWNSLMAELDSDVFFGPYINKNGLSGTFSPNLIHTGLCLEVAIATKKIDVPILHNKLSPWWRENDYVVPVEGVGFSFSHSWSGDNVVDGHPVHRLFHVLGTILRHRTKKNTEILYLLSAMEPLLEHSGATPLKKNALRTLIPKYSKMGFATAPAKLQKASLVVRILWVYPKFRGPNAISNYLRVGTVKFPLTSDYCFETGRIEFPWYNNLASELGQLFNREHLADPITAFSEEGIHELRLPIRSRQSGGHQRTKLMNRRLEIIKELHIAGHGPKEIVVKLRAAGHYSRKVPLSQQVYQVESFIRQLVGDKTSPASGQVS